MKIQTIGILGAGKLGIVLAQLAVRAGYKVLIASSEPKEKIALTVEVLAPGALAEDSPVVAEKSDVVVLAIPLGKFRNIPGKELEGKLVIDAMNYWWEVDGERDKIVPDDVSSSEAVQEYLERSRVVKALNHMGYHDLLDEARPVGEAGRKAIAIAGDDESDVRKVEEIVNNLGFDPHYIGPLKAGRRLEAGGRAFGANVKLDELKRLLT